MLMSRSVEAGLLLLLAGLGCELFVGVVRELSECGG